MSKSKALNKSIIFYVFLCSGAAIVTIYSQTTLLMTIGIIGIITFNILNRVRKIDKGLDAIALMFCCFAILISMIMNCNGDIKRYLNYLFCIVIAFSITKIVDGTVFLNSFSNVMVFLTLISLIGYFLVNNTTLLTVLPQAENGNGAVYAIGYVFNYLVNMPYRNCGFFWEPGVFATFLCYALIYEILFRNIRLWRVCLFSIGIFTANSSAGYALWAICMLLILVKRRNIKNNAIIYNVITSIIFILAILIILNLDQILINTVLKDNPYLMKLSSEHIASSERGYAFSHNINLFLKQPITGIGFQKADAFMAHYADTSTSTYLMSVFGIFGLSFTVFWIIAIVKQKNMGVYSKIAFIVIIMSIINKEPHGLIMFTWILFFYLLSRKSSNIISVST